MGYRGHLDQARDNQAAATGGATLRYGWSEVTREPCRTAVQVYDALRERGMDVTQATVSRDIAELGLVKIARSERHVYVAAEDVAGSGPAASDDLLRRLLGDIPITVGRSGQAINAMFEAPREKVRAGRLTF